MLLVELEIVRAAFVAKRRSDGTRLKDRSSTGSTEEPARMWPHQNGSPTIKQQHMAALPEENKEEAKEDGVGKHERMKQKQKLKSPSAVKEMEYVGPDTSSLSAFLLSLLSFSEPSTPFNDETADGSDSEEKTSTSSSQSKGELQGSHEFDPVGTSFIVEPRKLEKGDEYFPSTSGGDDLDSDWQVISDKDLVMNAKEIVTYPRYFDPPTVQAMQQVAVRPQPQPQPKPLKLPEMSEVSSLLSVDLRNAIYPFLPTLAKGRQWVLLYSTMKHGISLRTLYRKAGLIPGPCLLVAGDRLGAIFGGLLLSPKPTPKKKYQGTNDSFVFTNVGGVPKVFRPTGSNRYYALCTNDAIAFGGGGHFALHLDSELLYGSSAACETYGNSGLATTEDFVVKNVELWGFAHTSRYVPFHASFKEPEIAHGIYSW